MCHELTKEKNESKRSNGCLEKKNDINSKIVSHKPANNAGEEQDHEQSNKKTTELQVHGKDEGNPIMSTTKEPVAIEKIKKCDAAE